MSNSLPLVELETAAKDVMDPLAFAYVSGGAGQEKCLNRSRSAWGRIYLKPKPMSSLLGFSTEVQFAAADLSFPCFVAPMAYQKLATQDGERASHMAALAQGAGYVLSCQTSVRPSELGSGPFWFQLYLQPDPKVTVALIQSALSAGATALVVTIDAPVNGIRNREAAVQFTLPSDIRPVMFEGYGMPTGTIEELAAMAPTWTELEQICRHSPVPVYAKGIMTAEAAKRAIDCGCAGLIVSNHGGRVLDGLPATAVVLPSIRQAVPEATLLVDGGIRTGEDIFRAIALGANAVLVGRPIFYALALDGALGVSTCLRRLRDEFAATMALCGAARVADINGDYLYWNE
jgi:4-hydroxymandelate oxidase